MGIANVSLYFFLTLFLPWVAFHFLFKAKLRYSKIYALTALVLSSVYFIYIVYLFIGIQKSYGENPLQIKLRTIIEILLYIMQMLFIKLFYTSHSRKYLMVVLAILSWVFTSILLELFPVDIEPLVMKSIDIVKPV